MAHRNGSTSRADVHPAVAAALADLREPRPEPFKPRRYVDADGFDLVLGKTALAVWRKLVFLRDAGTDPGGPVHPTEEGLAKHLPNITVTMVERAMKRLRSLGLVENVGWRWMMVPAGGRMVRRRVYLRKVLGKELPRRGNVFHIVDGGVQREWQVALPGEVLLKIRNAPRHGGKRAGAGGPRKASSGSSAGEPDGVSSGRRFGCSSGRTNKSEATTKAKTSSFSYEKEGERADEAGAPRLFSTSGKARAVRPDLVPPAPVVPVPPPARPGETPVVVPPAPWNVEGLEAPVVPGPPLLPAEPDRDPWILRQAYEAVTGVRILSRPGQLERSAGTGKLLAECGEVLREEGFPPLAWAQWSVDRWVPKPGGPAVAPLWWVFSATRARKPGNAAWFRSDHGDELPCSRRPAGTVVRGPAREELSRRHAQMRLGLLTARPGSDRERAVVDYCFPPGTYEDLVERARVESSTIQEELKRRIARGEYVWDLPHAGGKTSAVN